MLLMTFFTPKYRHLVISVKREQMSSTPYRTQHYGMCMLRWVCNLVTHRSAIAHVGSHSEEREFIHY